jgi:hypothetical protein
VDRWLDDGCCPINQYMRCLTMGGFAFVRGTVTQDEYGGIFSANRSACTRST